MDVISDFLLNSKLMAEIEKERAIIEEINMYEDAPMDTVGDALEESYGDQPAGWEVLGPKKTSANSAGKILLLFGFAIRFTEYGRLCCWQDR